MSNTIRSGIVELANILNDLRNNTDDRAQADEIQKSLKVLMVLLDEVVRQKLDANTKDYKDAITALDKATEAAKDALNDSKKVAAAIEKAVKAAKLVDKLVALIAKYA